MGEKNPPNSTSQLFSLSLFLVPQFPLSIKSPNTIIKGWTYARPITYRLGEPLIIVVDSDSIIRNC